MSLVQRAKEALEQATLRATRSGEMFKDVGAGLEMREAYDAWMRARAAAGDAFALLLGYTATGWSFAAWERGR